MAIYYCVFTISYIFARLARNAAARVQNISFAKIYLWLVITVIVLFSGLRAATIGDTYTYVDIYRAVGTNLHAALSGDDKGFYLLVLLLNYISSDPQIMLLVTALITNLLIIKTLYHYTTLFELSIFLYFATDAYLVSMNGLRQYLAAAILFIATRYIISGNWRKYFFIVLVASTIHLSALLMILVYFLVRRDAWSWKTVLLLLLVLTAAALFNDFSSMMFSALHDTQYAHYKDIMSNGAHGASIIRVIIAGLPLVLAYIGRDRLRAMYPYSDIIVNMSILNLVFMIFALHSWFFARYCIYFGLYNLILVPWLIPAVIQQKSRPLAYLTVIIGYLAFFYYEQVITLHLYFASNYLKL